MTDTMQIAETATLLADAMRLAIAVGDDGAAHAVIRYVETVEALAEPFPQAVTQHCRGMLNHDPAQLSHAAVLYQTAGRPLPQAQALVAAGEAASGSGDSTAAREHFANARSLYVRLKATSDLNRIHTDMAQRSPRPVIVKAYNAVRGGAGKHIEAALPAVGVLVEKYAA